MILVSEEFKARYEVPVRLVPPYDRRYSLNTQEKIKPCIL